MIYRQSNAVHLLVSGCCQTATPSIPRMLEVIVRQQPERQVGGSGGELAVLTTGEATYFPV